MKSHKCYLSKKKKNRRQKNESLHRLIFRQKVLQHINERDLILSALEKAQGRPTLGTRSLPGLYQAILETCSVHDQYPDHKR